MTGTVHIQWPVIADRRKGPLHHGPRTSTSSGCPSVGPATGPQLSRLLSFVYVSARVNTEVPTSAHFMKPVRALRILLAVER